MTTPLPLYTIKRSDGVTKTFALDPDHSLADIRQQLVAKNFMSDADDFLRDNSPLDRDQEADISLSQVAKDGVVTIGVSSVSLGPGDPQRNIMFYQQLTAAQKTALFDNLELKRGLVLDADGISRSFNDIVSWGASVPSHKVPSAITQVLSDYSFNKTTMELKKSGVQKASASVDTPYGSGEAEYQLEKSKTNSKSTVTEYLLSKYVVNKVVLEVLPENLVVAEGFVEAVRQAMSADKQPIDQYVALLTVLAKWGYYLPVKFTLGGSLYATEKTEIKEVSEAETQKETFSGSFKAKFGDIGGGAAYSNAQSTEKTSTTSDKYKITTLTQVGGTAGTDKDFTKWMESLEPAVNWGVASYDEIMPSLGLLWEHEAQLASNCVKLIKQRYSYPSVKDLQPGLDLAKYAMQVETYYDSPY